jgi:hypothetical protein
MRLTALLFDPPMRAPYLTLAGNSGISPFLTMALIGLAGNPAGIPEPFGQASASGAQ